MNRNTIVSLIFGYSFELSAPDNSKFCSREWHLTRLFRERLKVYCKGTRECSQPPTVLKENRREDGRSDHEASPSFA